MRQLTIASIFTAVLIGMLAQTAAAQDKKIVAKGDDPGDMALMFNLSSVLNDAPTNFDGIGVGFRYVMAPRLTIRAGAGIDQSTDESEAGGTTVENKSSLYALEGGVEYMMFQTGAVGVYGGAILQFATGSDEPEGGPDISTRAFTLAGVFGVNYFLFEQLSLGAEYRLGYTQLRRENSDTDQIDTSSRIGTGSAGFILSFWFQ
ncbi:MAG: hypothetical protein CMH57_15440 [Myxococcales bacterium]|nr:hypothetical protein [Myxococcales bacterium]